MDRWHQKLTLRLTTETPLLLTDIAECLGSAGFLSNQDSEGAIYSLPRTDKIEFWQTRDLVVVTAFSGKEEVFFEHEAYSHWDAVEFGYLLPWQPFLNVHAFISKCFIVSESLALPLEFEGKPASQSRVLRRSREFATDLEKRMEAPGGEFLAQAIAMDLPV